MGDEDKYTAEEMAILGETPSQPPTGDQAPPEGGVKAPVEGEQPPAADTPAPKKEPEHTEEEKKAVEAAGLKIDEKGFIIDEEGTRIPAKRWKKVYWESQESKRRYAEVEAGKTEIERKFNLYRELGPDKFYEIYPEEKPASYQPKAAKARARESDPFDLVAQYPDPDHIHHGKTLREIYQEDPAEGRRLERAWERSQQEAQETATQTRQRLLDESEREIGAFSTSMARNIYGKDVNALTREESENVSKTIQETLDFMAKTNRGAGILADAYLLMNQEKIIADARTKGGKAALESLQRPGIPSINAGSGSASAGMSAFEAMSADQLAREIDNMDEKTFASFIRGASAALRAKHPGLAWD